MDGFSQNVNEPTHLFNHTLDLFLTCSIETEQLRVFPENPLFFITFHFTGVDYTALENKFLSESAVTRFNKVILHYRLLRCSVPTQCRTARSRSLLIVSHPHCVHPESGKLPLSLITKNRNKPGFLSALCVSSQSLTKNHPANASQIRCELLKLLFTADPQIYH